jgi:hypothetical protein
MASPKDEKFLIKLRDSQIFNFSFKKDNEFATLVMSTFND